MEQSASNLQVGLTIVEIIRNWLGFSNDCAGLLSRISKKSVHFVLLDRIPLKFLMLQESM